MTEERPLSYCPDCNEWLLSDTCDCCPYHMKDGEYHFMSSKKWAKIIEGLEYLEVRKNEWI